MSFDPKAFALSMKASGINTTAVKFTNKKADTVLSNGEDITGSVDLVKIDQKREDFVKTDMTPNPAIGGSSRGINSRFD